MLSIDTTDNEGYSYMATTSASMSSQSCDILVRVCHKTEDDISTSPTCTLWLPLIDSPKNHTMEECAALKTSFLI